MGKAQVDEAARMDDAFDDIGVPNCPACLQPMSLSGSGRSPRWTCHDCRIADLGGGGVARAWGW